MGMLLSAFSCSKMTGADYDIDITGSGVKLYLYRSPTVDLMLMHAYLGNDINKTVDVMENIACTPITGLINRTLDYFDDHTYTKCLFGICQTFWSGGIPVPGFVFDFINGLKRGCPWVLNKEKSDLRGVLQDRGTNGRCVTLKANPIAPVVGAGAFLNCSTASASASK
ncbi:MAG: hypothetical protein K8I02_02525, partial [Candidatus Methylomirabilis sp.]|nr:hypothetical protein [Deltaproteobacteria bacterium]